MLAGLDRVRRLARVEVGRGLDDDRVDVALEQPAVALEARVPPSGGDLELRRRTRRPGPGSSRRPPGPRSPRASGRGRRSTSPGRRSRSRRAVSRELACVPKAVLGETRSGVPIAAAVARNSRRLVLSLSMTAFPRLLDGPDLHVAEPEDAAVVLEHEAAGLREPVVRRLLPLSGVAELLPLGGSSARTRGSSSR